MLLYDPEGEEDPQEPHSNIQQVRPLPPRENHIVNSHRQPTHHSKSKEVNRPKLPSVEFRDNQYIRGSAVAVSPLHHGTTYRNEVRSIPKIPESQLSHHYHGSVSRGKLHSVRH